MGKVTKLAQANRQSSTKRNTVTPNKKSRSTEKEMTPLSKIPCARLGEPEDIANAVLFLASSYSDYVNGETLHVNGGMYMA